MKRVLIITYYWPPSGGGGVMRWLQMSKYLPEFGWQPVIYTPENPDASVVDESLMEDVPKEAEIIKTPIWEPYNIYRFFTGKQKNEKFKAGYVAEASKSGIRDKLSVFIRGNFLIPDPRKFWVKPSVKYLKKYLGGNPVDLIVSTGPPHSMHLIALGLKQKLNIPWLADFRDPWTHIDFYNTLKLTKWAHRKHFRLEGKVVTNADVVVTVSNSWAEQFEKDHAKKAQVVTNGFVPEKFNRPIDRFDEQFSITHIGSFNQDRNPHMFWEALKDLVDEHPEIKDKLLIRLVGQTDDQIIKSIRKAGFSDQLELISFVKHDRSLDIIRKSQLLLLPLNDTFNAMGIIPGKVFEYMAAQRPIFVIGPIDGDTAGLITKSKTGHVNAFADKSGMKAKLLESYELFKNKELILEENSFNQFSRRELAKQLLELATKHIN